VVGGTDVFGSFAYIEDWSRAAGIKVLSGSSMPTGQSVEISGTISTVNGERVITSSEVDLLGARALPGALFMAHRWVGGGAWRYNPGTGAGQMGVANGVGLNNLGMLVTVAGLVMDKDPSVTPLWFALSDGSGAALKVAVPTGVSTPALGAYVSVVGISSSEMQSAQLLRLIRARYESDIRTLLPPTP
jgi:hypothetical protein